MVQSDEVICQRTIYIDKHIEDPLKGCVGHLSLFDRDDDDT